MSINKVIVSGNLTRDPEVRYTNAGTAVMQFGIAVNERVKNTQTGEWEDRPNYFDCNLWGKRAEALQKYMTKGMKVAVEGRLRWSQWEKDGQKRSKVDILVDQVELMQKRDSNGAQAQQGYADSNYTSAPQTAAYNAPQYEQPTFDAASSVYDEDIPF